MAYWNAFYTPKTIEEAVGILSRYDGRACMIGGGTDLLLEIQQGHRPKMDALVDPSRIEELSVITEEDGYIVIGAGVTHSRIVQDDRIAQHGTCLVESCGVIGGPQVRNVATLAGNIAHALPAGDGTIGTLALDGEVQVARADGMEWAPMEDTFLGPGKSTVDSKRMMITRIRFKPTGDGEGSAFRRVMRPQGIALPMIGMAARVKLAGDVIESARIAIGPASTIPFLARKTMAYLVGQTPSAHTWQCAAETALEEVVLRDSPHRSSSAYRREMILTQLPRTLDKATERARTGQATPEGVGA
jgi:CO/xanthine dehydrogenase FAD-binding subunit